MNAARWPWAQGRSDAPDPERLVELVSERAARQYPWKRRLAAAGSTQWYRARRAAAVRVGALPELPPPTNVLGIGASGTGKTYIATLTLEALGIPNSVVDCTTLTASGEGDRPPASIVWDLLRATGDDVEAAAAGVALLDEVDKLAYRPRVQQELLRMLQSQRVLVYIRGKPVAIDTSGILFVACGAFTGLLEKLERARRADPGSDVATVADVLRRTSRAPERLPNDLAPEEISQFGLLTEFVGRLPDVVVLDPLSAGDLYDILALPGSCLWALQQECLERGVALEVPDSTRWAIATRAEGAPTGARALATAIGPLRQYMEGALSAMRARGLHQATVLPEHLDSGVPRLEAGPPGLVPLDLDALVERALDPHQRWLRDHFPPAVLPDRAPRLSGPGMAGRADLGAGDLLGDDGGGQVAEGDAA